MDILSKKQKHHSMAIFETSVHGKLTVMRVNGVQDGMGVEVVIDSDSPVSLEHAKKLIYEAGFPYSALIPLQRVDVPEAMSDGRRVPPRHALRLACTDEVDYANA